MHIQIEIRNDENSLCIANGMKQTLIPSVKQKCEVKNKSGVILFFIYGSILQKITSQQVKVVGNYNSIAECRH